MLAWPGATDGQVNTPPLLRAAPLLGSRSPSNRCRCDCFFQGEREDVTCREDSIELVLDGQDQFCQTVQDGREQASPGQNGPPKAALSAAAAEAAAGHGENSRPSSAGGDVRRMHAEGFGKGQEGGQRHLPLFLP